MLKISLRFGFVGVVLVQALAARAGDHPAVVQQSFVMTESEDGKAAADSFEVWDTVCFLRKSSLTKQPFCSINAVSLVESSGRTHIYTWRHDSKAVAEVKPNIFRLQMNGRMNSCSGVELIVSMDSKAEEVRDISATMSTGTECQSVRTFRLDTKSSSRRVAPIWNPTYREAQ